MNENFVIEDLEKFTNSARTVVFNGFGKAVIDTPDDFTNLMVNLSDEDKSEMDIVLTQKESLIIVEQNARRQINKKTKKTRYIIDEKIFLNILDALNARLVSNLLANLSKEGLIESAYDESINDFVFWVKDDNKKEKPETN
jgi:hypothetical protein